MWIVPFSTPSGDEVIVGPFETAPTQKEVMELLSKWCSEEAEYLEEVGMGFVAYELTDTPGVLCLPMEDGTLCEEEECEE